LLVYFSMKSLAVMYDCVVYDTLSARETLLARVRTTDDGRLRLCNLSTWYSR
jgi:hypothetical protein